MRIDIKNICKCTVDSYNDYYKTIKLNNIRKLNASLFEYSILTSRVFYLIDIDIYLLDDTDLRQLAQIYKILLHYHKYLLINNGFVIRYTEHNKQPTINLINTLNILLPILSNYIYNNRNNLICLCDALMDYSINNDTHVSNVDNLFLNVDYVKSLCEFL